MGVRLLEAVGGVHGAVGLQARALRVADAVQGRDHLGEHSPGLVERVTHRARVGVRELGKRRKALKVDDLVQHEIDVTQWRAVRGAHGHAF